MSPATKDDDEDWVGTPPEGLHTRDQADPDYWRSQYGRYALGAGVLIALIVLVVVGAFVFG